MAGSLPMKTDIRHSFKGGEKTKIGRRSWREIQQYSNKKERERTVCLPHNNSREKLHGSGGKSVARVGGPLVAIAKVSLQLIIRVRLEFAKLLKSSHFGFGVFREHDIGVFNQAREYNMRVVEKKLTMAKNVGEIERKRGDEILKEIEAETKKYIEGHSLEQLVEWGDALEQLMDRVDKRLDQLEKLEAANPSPF